MSEEVTDSGAKTDSNEPPLKLPRTTLEHFPTLPASIEEYVYTNTVATYQYVPFQINHEGYFEIGRAEYSLMRTVDSRLPRYYSLEEYQHFRCAILKLREFHVDRRWSQRYPWLRDALDFVDYNNLLLPEPTACYLEGIGDFWCPSGERFTLEPNQLDVYGSFGQMEDPAAALYDAAANEARASRYLFSACPLVTYSVLQDRIRAIGNVQYAAGHTMENWAGAAPNAYRLMPTWSTNFRMCNYPYEPIMSPERRNAIANTRQWNIHPVAGDSPPFSWLCLDAFFVREWDNCMKQMDGKFPIRKGFPMSQEGSISQGLTIVDHRAEKVDDAHLEYNAGFRANGGEKAHALFFKYRLERSEPERAHFAEVHQQAGVNLYDIGQIHLLSGDHRSHTLDAKNLRISPQSTHQKIVSWIASAVGRKGR